MNVSELFELRTRQGQPRQIRHVVIQSESRALILRLPFGGVVWNWPRAVIVEDRGVVTRLPITDVTRLAVWALAFAGVIGAWVVRRSGRT
jgi:hypothetical protein